MSWTTPADLKEQLLRRWQRGDLLRAQVTGEVIFPLRLRLKTPTASELAAQFEAVRAWVAALVAVPNVRIDWRDVAHRVHGAQRLPEAVWVDSLDDAMVWLGQRRAAERFERVLASTRAHHAALLPWLAKRPLQALELAEVWPALLAVVDWLIQRPHPGIYLRQVDIAGVHSKFIESHRAVLTELLDLVLLPEAINADYHGVGQFAARYGFCTKPERIRLRVLDEQLQVITGLACPDLTLDADSFSRLDIAVRCVFITENEINFLAFPPQPGAIVIFGAGYGWEALARAEWLTGCTMHYWGDIDTHGFAILDQLRGRFPHVESLLMDRATLLAHEAFWGTEPDPIRHDLRALTTHERALYDDLRDNRIRPSLRLEQELIGFDWVRAALDKVR